MCTIEKNQKVSISYTLRDSEGQVIESAPLSRPLAYLHGYNNIVPGLEKFLEGHKEGESLHIVVKSEDAYGPWQEDLLIEVPREDLEDLGDLYIGMEIEMIREDENDEPSDPNEALIRSLRLPQDPSELFASEEDDEEQELYGEYEDPDENPSLFYIREIYDSKVIIDGNHPLAGKDLVFDVKIVEVDSPTFEEIEQGFLNENEVDQDL
jgi:FKBP-type peptidyl-prolyl cis-trans isomerase SlyD